MKVLINMSNRLVSQALESVLRTNGNEFHTLNAHDEKDSKNYVPDIIIVDVYTMNKKIFTQNPESKVVLIDLGLKPDELLSTLISYKLHGVISTATDVELFKKALKVIYDGQIWLSHETMKTFLHNSETVHKAGKIDGLTNREKQIISCVCQGFNNKQIASALSVSEQTVKAHLNRIFRKYNISNRSQLVALSLNHAQFHN